MKYIKFFALLFLGIIIFSGGCGQINPATDPNIDNADIFEEEKSSSAAQPDEHKPIFLRGAWVPTVYNITYPAYATANSILLKQGIDSIVAYAAAAGLNALFFQVRPCADAFYPSDIFPWSKYLTGEQGRAPDNNFDPLAYIIEKCHSAGIALHAWINPYRITALAADTIIPSHPASVMPQITFNVGGKLYFNPASSTARDLIIEGVREIVETYDVDGIQFDDYFYPENIADEDLLAFESSSNGINNLADWRRNNVDELIRETYLMLKSVKPDVVFGVSPSGIWANKSRNAAGSNTLGFESYYDIYADTRMWVNDSYVDYIAPQIYWYIGQTGSDYLTVLNWWRDVCDGTGVLLYAGLAGYKQDEAWADFYELANQADLAVDLSGGFIIYNFNDLFKQSVLYAINNSY